MSSTWPSMLKKEDVVISEQEKDLAGSARRHSHKQSTACVNPNCSSLGGNYKALPVAVLKPLQQYMLSSQGQSFHQHLACSPSACRLFAGIKVTHGPPSPAPVLFCFVRFIYLHVCMCTCACLVHAEERV